MKIEWASSFNPDGSRREPDPSYMHGFYAKWRGTFSGNENLRNKGMKEMREATRFKRAEAKKKREARKAEGRSVFSFFFNRKKSSKSGSSSRRSRSTNVLTRPSTSRQSTGNSRGDRSTRPSRTSHGGRSSPRHISKSSHSRSHHTSRSGHSRSEHRSRRSSRR